MFYKIKTRKGYPAAFTLEATMVMGIVLMALLAVIRYGCVLHDEVTSSMILEESLEKVRYLSDDLIKEEMKGAETEGIQAGNPRIWLGEYGIKIKSYPGMLSGEAKAGDWETEIWIPKFRPGDFLRESSVFSEIGEGQR